MTAIGMDGMDYITTKDPIHAMTMVTVFDIAQKEVDRLDRERANKIAQAVGKLFK